MVLSLEGSDTREGDPQGCQTDKVGNQTKQKAVTLAPTVAITSGITELTSFNAERKLDQNSLPKSDKAREEMTIPTQHRPPLTFLMGSTFPGL